MRRWLMKNLKTQARCFRPARLLAFLIWGQAANAAWLNQSQITDTVANQALTQLVSNQTLPAAQQKQLFSTGLKALFAELTPAIQAMPDYTGQFVANCSIFMNTQIEQVLCEINSTIALGRPESCGQSSLLPLEYEHQITESAILLVSFYADWTGKTSLSSESYAVRLFDRMPTCTVSASVSKTGPALSQTLSPTESISLSPTTSPSAPVVWNPQWANWQVTTGVYRDNANQTGRYFESVPWVITDRMTGLQWQKVGSAPASNWTAAQAYCANLFESGFGDWRLPTHVELQTLVDYTMDCSGPSVDRDFFPSTQTSSYYWSSDAVQGYPGSAWWVSYGSGAYYAGLVCSQGYSGGCFAVPASGFVRCVRPWSVDREVGRYTFNNTQVLDTVTGLNWQRTVSGTYNWSAAQAYCAGLNLDGLSWRLPSIKELSTLLDVRVASPGPTINTTVFPSTYQTGFWASTPYSCASPSRAWNVNFGYGSVATYGISNTLYVRCVCSPQVYNAEWANWQVTTGVYRDNANQTGRYLESVPGVITDQMTSLQWQKVGSAPAGNWTAAQAYCADLFESRFG
ncbi:MAG: DUF1566 domain-containing protein, partial [Myxococcaceae bacterium]|nr:DUF1566 domain-containing protein [Myxococcaceae bacterium]